MAHRVLMFSKMVVTSVEDRRWSFERQRAQLWICEMEEVLREAADQGDPTDGVVTNKPIPRAKTASGDKVLEKHGLTGPGKFKPKIYSPSSACDF